MAQVFVKLMAKGLRSKEHDRFAFDAGPEPTIRSLIPRLHAKFGKRMEIYMDNVEKRTLKRETIIFLNGKNAVSAKGLDSSLSDGDLVVFMIAAVGG